MFLLEILLRRLRASWEDTAPNYTQASPEYVQAIQEANQRRREQHAEQVAQAQPMWQDRREERLHLSSQIQSYWVEQILQYVINLLQDDKRNIHRLFHCHITLVFIIQSELTDSQRERLISAMSLRGVQLPQITYEAVKAQCHELFITTRTNIQDPNIRPSGGSRSRTFYILEAGEYEGEEGFWVEDEEGAEGFCPLVILAVRRP